MTATTGPNPGEKRVSGEIPQTEAPKSDEPLRTATLAEIGRAFLKLGLTSFGGPVAHLGYFRDEFVHRRQWLSDPAYADLVALCQFLPGPSSTQLAFVLGMRQAKLPGGLVAALCFTLPSAVLMILFGIGISSLGDWRHAGWLHGLKLAAVVVVAQAVWGMGRALCPDRTRLAIALASAAALLVLTHPVAQISVVAAGSLLGWWHYPTQANAGPQPAAIGWRNHLPAAISLGIFFLVLLLLPILAAVTGSKGIEVFGGFYRVGSLVFGGGHVVLPLLRSEVVPKGWVGDDAFLAGYGVAQALPGPLFTFGAYLGTVMRPGPRAWLNGLWCLVAITLPGLLLVGGVLPFWNQLRAKTWAQAALRGANAAVVGMLLAAFYNPVWREGIRSAPDVAAVIVLIGLARCWNTPPWLSVLLAAGFGACGL